MSDVPAWMQSEYACSRRLLVTLWQAALGGLGLGANLVFTAIALHKGAMWFVVAFAGAVCGAIAVVLAVGAFGHQLRMYRALVSNNAIHRMPEIISHNERKYLP